MLRSNCPPEAKSLGHYGEVVIQADVSAEGNPANLVIVQSSRSKILDDLALTKSSSPRFKLGDGAKAVGKVRLNVDFSDYDFDNLGLGYQCKQAVLDADWYKTLFPDKPIESNKFTKYLRGAGLIDHRLKFAQDKAQFAKAWLEAIEYCRTTPDAPLMGIVVLAGNGKLPHSK
ncbi:TonB family protein [Sphingomonas sp. UYAg733]